MRIDDKPANPQGFHGILLFKSWSLLCTFVPGHTITEDDERMIKFVMDAFEDETPFDSKSCLHPDLLRCFEWMAARSTEEAIRDREAVISAIERDAAKFREAGLTATWFGAADNIIKEICVGINGPLLELLLKLSGHVDPLCANMFRDGAPLVGKLPVSGNGVRENKRPHESIEHLKNTAAVGNSKVVKRLRQDPFASEILKQTMQDAALGRMTWPADLSQVQLEDVRISHRFGVDQGLKSDGSRKIRCVDSCTESGINPCTEATEHLSTDGLDSLFQVMTWLQEEFGIIPHIFKVDVDSAFRRVPVDPAHRWAAHVAFTHEGQVWTSGHLSMPFGAASSVYAWDRVGAAIVRIA